MKKLRTIITAVLLSFVGFTFVACDDDWDEMFDDFENIEEANVLYGTWEGYLGTYYEDRWGVGGEDYITTIRFDKPYHDSSSGRGYEVDRNRVTGEYYYCEFRWMIDRGEIVIIYDDNIYEPVYIYDYVLTKNRFRGYMDDGTNREIRFDFRYVSHFDWGVYYSAGPAGTRNKLNVTDEKNK